MNLPNKLTLLRVILVPFMVAVLLSNIPHNYLIAGLIFAVASITDYFDGKIARARNLITDFGKLVDPVADKLLVTAAITCFVENGLCSSWVLIIILAREFAVTSMRMVAAGRGNVIAANMWGKVKTVSQMFSIIAIFVMQWIAQLTASEALGSVFFVIGSVLLWICAGLTLISGAVYMLQNKEVFSDM